METNFSGKGEGKIIQAYVLPGLPQPLLCPEKNPGYQRLHNAFKQVRQEIESSGADLLMIYSTMWPGIIGHQIQANPDAKWVHVDELFHDLGSTKYHFRFDQKFAEEYKRCCEKRGLSARTVNYDGFPIDTGSVTVLKLLDLDIPSVITSSNVYSDRAETIVLAKAGRDAIARQKRNAVVLLISTLSNRLHREFIDPQADRIHSLKDEEWNRKLLEFFEAGRLEDVSQLSRQIHTEARVKKVVTMKSFWWLAGIVGQHNRYQGSVYAYEPVYGAGSAIIRLVPSDFESANLEFDEEDPEVYAGIRNVLNDPEDQVSADSFRVQASKPVNPVKPCFTDKVDMESDVDTTNFGDGFVNPYTGEDS